jgi:hypothetical protein
MIDKAPMIAACGGATPIRRLCLIGIQYTVGQVRHVRLCRELPVTIIQGDTTAVRSTDGHVLGWRVSPLRLRRFLIHGQVRLAQLVENVGGHDLPLLGARITPHVMVRTIVDLGAMVFVSHGWSRGRGRHL